MTRQRSPYGIRRHYSEEEKEVIKNSGPSGAAAALRRPRAGTKLKEDRMRGLRVDTHYKDPTGKERWQAETKAKASRNGQPWEAWEDDRLLLNPHLETLAEKAEALGRTYRAVESRRSDLLKKIDGESS